MSLRKYGSYVCLFCSSVDEGQVGLKEISWVGSDMSEVMMPQLGTHGPSAVI